MKIKAIAAMCKRNKRIYLFDQISEDGLTQWIGDGSCIYPLYNLPELDIDGICTMFDIPEKDKDKILFNRSQASPMISFADIEETESAISPLEPAFSAGGAIVQPYQSRRGILFLNAASLKPLGDSLDYLELYERETDDGLLYIAAKTGMILQGIILPERIEAREFLKKLRVIAELMEAQERAESFSGAQDGQTTLEETGR